MNNNRTSINGDAVPSARSVALPEQLGMGPEIAHLNGLIVEWLENANREFGPLLRWQLLSSPKYFRPVTLVACYYAMTANPIPSQVMTSAVALEMVHNVSLIVDDILDYSRYRRGKLSLHCRFGRLPAMMASGYIFAGAIRLVAEDSYSVGLLATLLQRLGTAECRQWRLRREPLGVEDWRLIAAEDTGSMFESAACLGTRDYRLREFGQLLGILYHGCDDVADVRGANALGGGGNEDVKDRILTLPAAFAIQRPDIAARYRSGNAADDEVLNEAYARDLPAAEAYLDQIAFEAVRQARQHAVYPQRLVTLVEHTRALSRR